MTLLNLSLPDYRLALLLHPDSSHPSASPSNFATLHRAYTLLSTPRSRQLFEQFGQGWSSSSSDASEGAYDSFRTEAMFRGRAAAETRRSNHRRNRADAGGGAWGYWGMDGRWRPFPEANIGKDREPSFVAGTNGWAVATVAVSRAAPDHAALYTAKCIWAGLFLRLAAVPSMGHGHGDSHG